MISRDLWINASSLLPSERHRWTFFASARRRRSLVSIIWQLLHLFGFLIIASPEFESERATLRSPQGGTITGGSLTADVSVPPFSESSHPSDGGVFLDHDREIKNNLWICSAIRSREQSPSSPQIGQMIGVRSDCLHDSAKSSKSSGSMM
jgi:hypothetical protein